MTARPTPGRRRSREAVAHRARSAPHTPAPPASPWEQALSRLARARLARDDVVTVPCDALVPAPLESAIHAGNAAAVRASLIVEGANGRVTSDADAVLEDRGITVVPDILANAGGAITSHLETSPDRDALTGDEATVRLERRLGLALDRTRAFALTHAVALRDAAMALGVQAVVTHHARGLFP